MRAAPLVLAFAALSLAACATTRMSDADRLALYTSHAGAPVKTIRYNVPNGWEKVDDDHLLLTVRPKEAWLMKISGPCLDWGSGAPAISISQQAGWVSAGFDTVSVAGVPVSCRILEIRPVDTIAVRDARNAIDAQASAR